MCSPQIEKAVRERIKQEGQAQLSRRNLLKLGGMTAAGLAVSSVASPVRRASAQVSSVVDLSHVFATDVPTYLLGENPAREDYVTVENNGFYIQR